MVTPLPVKPVADLVLPFALLGAFLTGFFFGVVFFGFGFGFGFVFFLLPFLAITNLQSSARKNVAIASPRPPELLEAGIGSQVAQLRRAIDLAPGLAALDRPREPLQRLVPVVEPGFVEHADLKERV